MFAAWTMMCRQPSVGNCATGGSLDAVGGGGGGGV